MPATNRTPDQHQLARRAPQARETRDIQRYLHALFHRESPGAFIEVRYRHRDSMRRHFFAHTDTFAAARAIARLGLNTDVYVGVAARRSRHAGGKDAIARVWTLWADLDDADAHHALEQLPVAPAILIASGIIRSDQLQRGCRRADPCWRHVASESESDAAGGRR